MDSKQKAYYKKQFGALAVVIYKRKILIAKRALFPLIMHSPGSWTFIQGSRKKGEPHIRTAYRELYEEARLGKEELRLLRKPIKMWFFDRSNRLAPWYQMVFFFESKTDKVRINFENLAYRWASYSDLVRHKKYDNIFVDEKRFFKILKMVIGST